MRKHNPEIKRIPIKNLKLEDGAVELGDSTAMEPYTRFFEVHAKQQDVEPFIAEIAELPLEKRYVWRITSALKWAFADFDSETVRLDRETLSPEDLAKLARQLQFRPYQFSKFLDVLFGNGEDKDLSRHAEG